MLVHSGLDPFMLCSSPDNRELCCVLLFDRDFTVECGLDDTGIHHGLLITNQSRYVVCCYQRIDR